MRSLLARLDPFASTREVDGLLGSLDIGDAGREMADISGQEAVEVELIGESTLAISSPHVLVTLVPDPFHRLGADTIGVELDGHLVGRLRARDAERHAPRIHDLMWQDVTIRCRAAAVSETLVLFMGSPADRELAPPQGPVTVSNRGPAPMTQSHRSGRLLVDGECIDVSSGRIEVRSSGREHRAGAS